MMSFYSGVDIFAAKSSTALAVMLFSAALFDRTPAFLSGAFRRASGASAGLSC